MKQDKGIELLRVLRLQRQFFIRNANGERIITDWKCYNLLENESIRLQELIGKENKKEYAIMETLKNKRSGL